MFAKEPSTKRYDFDVPRGSLISAFAEISNKTGLQIGTGLGEKELQATQVGPVSGSMTVKSLLDKLLTGTGLSFAWVDQYTIRIFTTVVEPPQAEDGVQTVMVTGSRLSGETAAPVRATERSKIDELGASTLPNLARYFTQQSFSFGSGHLASGAQHFQMRGLGFDTTLVLLNGRRVAASADSDGLNAVDLNGIPLTAVERIEVMSDSASAIYGADAIGGVVNIITRKDIKDTEVYLHYGGADGGGTERRAAVSLGTEGRLQSAMVFDYFEHYPLMGAKRSLWRDQDYRRYGGHDYRATNSNPGNVYSLTGGSLPGLPASTAAVPSEALGRDLTPTNFISPAGEINRESLYRYRSASNGARQKTAFGTAEFSVSPELSVFGEMLAVDREVLWQQGQPMLSRARVPATNPFNPFGEDVAVDYLFSEMAPVRVPMNSMQTRFVLGTSYSASGWKWELTGVRSDERAVMTQVNDLDHAKVTAALASTDPATALNLFSDGAAGSDSLLASLVGGGWKNDTYSEMTQVSAFVRGSLFPLPAGNSEFILGGEWRREGISWFSTLGTNMDFDREVRSTFAEIRVPVTRGLSLHAALRDDRYGESNDSLNPQFGLVWRPSKDWLVRASYGTSFRPASLVELYAPPNRFPYSVVDPRRSGEVTTIELRTGGNSDLTHVRAHSLTAGLAFTSEWVQGLRWSGNYWRVELDDSIVIPMQILSLEDKFPDRVGRAEPSEQDLLLGRSGALQYIDVRRINFGRIDTSGVDMDASYTLKRSWGTFDTTLSATWVRNYLSEGPEGVRLIDRVGAANESGTILPWRVVGSVIWTFGEWGISGAATFTPRYRDVNPTGTSDRRLPSRTLMDVQGWIKLGSLVGEDSWLAQTKLAIGVLNLFDRAADFAEVGMAMGYDQSQSDMTQRFAYIRLSSNF